MRVRDRLAREWAYNLDFDISVLGDPACRDKRCQHEDQSAWEEMSHDAQRCVDGLNGKRKSWGVTFDVAIAG